MNDSQAMRCRTSISDAHPKKSSTASFKFALASSTVVPWDANGNRTMTEIFTQHHKSYGFPPPPVLPFVFHQGPESWSISSSFEEFLDCPVSTSEVLGVMGLEELEDRHRDLHREYETHFKTR